MNLSNDQFYQLKHRIDGMLGPLKIVVGAGSVYYGNDWIHTNIEELDILNTYDWARLFKAGQITNILAEHVFEHLTMEECKQACNNMWAHLVSGGILRIAVPDGLHPDPAYIRQVMPNGSGAGAKDHKVLYNFASLSRLLKDVGFEVHCQEYWDGDGNFNFNTYDEDFGRITRSLMNDERNEGGRKKSYTSLIIDAVKIEEPSIAEYDSHD